jgi:porin
VECSVHSVDDTAATSSIRALLGHDGGVSLEPVYRGEVFTNTRGGISTRNATQYEGLLDLALEIDFEKSGWHLPGRFFLLAQNTHGRGLTEDFIGDFQVVSNIDSFANIMQVSEYWWEIGLFGQGAAVRLGKQDVNTEFLALDSAGDFIHSSFGLSPTAGLPSYPDPTMAALLLAQLTESLQLKVGVWDALGRGGNWGFSGNETTVTIGELEQQYALCGGSLPGTVEVGMVYFSGGDVSGQDFPWRRGYYVQVEQMLVREDPCQEDDRQGLGAIARYASRYGNRYLPITSVWEDALAGIVYRGPIPSRDDDVVGAGVAWAQLSQDGTLQETTVELFYKFQLRSGISIQPDLQYIARPSGIYRDALAGGIRFEAGF